LKASVFAASICAFGLAAQAAPTGVPGTANPFYAGRHATGPTGANDDGSVPPRVPGTFPAGTVIGFKVSGGASYVSSCCDPLDGDGPFSMTSLDSATGIAGLDGGRPSSLVGVFLGNGVPRPPAPARLNFDPNSGGVDITFKQLSPALNQMFFIGDGLTGSGKGQRQRFTVPAGATRLFLAVDDGFGWYDNSGTITVKVIVLAPAP
jgi:hypothetical protein